MAAGFFAVVFADFAAPVFALVDLAAPIFALVDFGAGVAVAGVAVAVFALVDFAAVAFAAVLFAAIPRFLRGELLVPIRMQDVRRYQSRTTADTDCGRAK